MWLARFQTFTKSKSLERVTDEDYKAFLTFLAVEKNVAASSQNQAFNALLFFFRHVMKREPGETDQTGYRAYVSPQFCHSFAGGRL